MLERRNDKVAKGSGSEQPAGVRGVERRVSVQVLLKQEPDIEDALGQTTVTLLCQPGVSGTTGLLGKEVRRRRIVLNQNQKDTLRAWFEKNPNPDLATRGLLAKELGISESQIMTWFQKHRKIQKQVEFEYCFEESQAQGQDKPKEFFMCFSAVVMIYSSEPLMTVTGFLPWTEAAMQLAAIFTKVKKYHGVELHTIRSYPPVGLKENHPVILRGQGFHYAQNLSQTMCRFKISDSKVIDKNATDKNFTVITCPRPEIKQSRQLPRHCQHVHHNQRSIRYHGPGWKLFPCLGKGFRNYNQGQMEHMRQNWHQGPSREKDCQGVFDLYFILDKSGSMAGNWKNIYSFIENFVKKFQNPKLRMSFITYSTDADTLLPLTSDREAIHSGLLILQKLVPEGRAFMHKGFMKANEQIRDATLAGNSVNTVIIALTAGPLMTHTFKETLEEANKSRRMGAAVYTVGVHEYDKQQIIDIADNPSNSFGVDKGFPAMQVIIDPVSKWDVEDWGDPVCIPRGLLDPVSKWDVEDWGDPVCIPRGLLDPLVSRSCSELLFVQPSTVCIK
ncbi:hypothetical protein STEG23_029100, partial [Scotinomys teguina]